MARVQSQLTPNEASVGDPSAAAERLKLLDGLPLLEINADTEALAARLLAARDSNDEETTDS